MGESDSESDSEEDEGEKRIGIKEEEKEESSVVIDNGGNSDSSKEVDASSGSVAGGSNEQGSSENGSEEEGTEEPLKSVIGLDGNGNTSMPESPDGSEDKNGVISPGKSHSTEAHEVVGQQPGSEDEVVSVAEIRDDSAAPEAVSLESIEKPLNFDDYHSAAELEVLGLERLKSELLGRGLKCGGTLQERAARLFLLKTTPLEMLPKKLFAKK